MAKTSTKLQGSLATNLLFFDLWVPKYIWKKGKPHENPLLPGSVAPGSGPKGVRRAAFIQEGQDHEWLTKKSTEETSVSRGCFPFVGEMRFHKTSPALVADHNAAKTIAQNNC